ENACQQEKTNQQRADRGARANVCELHRNRTVAVRTKGGSVSGEVWNRASVRKARGLIARPERITRSVSVRSSYRDEDSRRRESHVSCRRRACPSPLGFIVRRCPSNVLFGDVSLRAWPPVTEECAFTGNPPFQPSSDQPCCASCPF